MAKPRILVDYTERADAIGILSITIGGHTAHLVVEAADKSFISIAAKTIQVLVINDWHDQLNRELVK